jgi:hypothetical protein
VKSHSTPNLRASASITPPSSSRPLLDSSPNAATQKSLLRRALSLQNLSAEDHRYSASTASASISPNHTAFSLHPHIAVSKRRQHASSFFPASSGTVTNSLFYLPKTLSPSQDNAIIPTQESCGALTSDAVDEEDYVTYSLDEDFELEASAADTFDAPDHGAASPTAPNTFNSSSANNPLVPTFMDEWFAEPSNSLAEDVVVLPVSLKRRVSFDPIASVILIPTKEEYHSAGLHSDLWYRGHEMRQFKQDAYREVQALMWQENIVHVKEAFRRLSMTDEADEIASNTHRNMCSHRNQYTSGTAADVTGATQPEPFAQSLSLTRQAAVSGNLQELGAFL